MSAITVQPNEQALDIQRRAAVGAAADHAAREGVFADYAERRAANTLRRQRVDLATFARYLEAVQFHTDAEALQTEPAAWAQITYGTVAGFVRWQLAQGYAVGTINVKLSTVKQYAKLAFQAGVIDPSSTPSFARSAATSTKSRSASTKSAAPTPCRPVRA